MQVCPVHYLGAHDLTICSMVMLGKTFTPKQWFALLVLSIGVSICQYKPSESSQHAPGEDKVWHVDSPVSTGPEFSVPGLWDAGSDCRMFHQQYCRVPDFFCSVLVIDADCVFASVYTEKMLKQNTVIRTLIVFPSSTAMLPQPK